MFAQVMPIFLFDGPLTVSGKPFGRQQRTLSTVSIVLAGCRFGVVQGIPACCGRVLATVDYRIGQRNRDRSARSAYESSFVRMIISPDPCLVRSLARTDIDEKQHGFER